MKNETNFFLEINEKKNTIYPNLQDTVKAVLRGKFIALIWREPHISSCMAHPRALEQKEEIIQKGNR